MSGITSNSLNFGSPSSKYKYNYKELQSKEFSDGSGIEWHDYGARMYDQQIGRWHVIDNYADVYYALTPYNYGGNCPVNTIDVDGNLFIFANGFVPAHYLGGQNQTINVPTRWEHDGFSRYPIKWQTVLNQNLYAPDREFYRDGPKNNGNTFKEDYWGKIDDYYMIAYRDANAYYTNGSFTPKSQANTRLNEGYRAGVDLIGRLESGKIKLKAGETIKIVGHSQGAAYAAGIAWALSNSKYGSLVEFVDYLSPHQPGEFTHPSGIKGRQFSTENDRVSSGAGPLGWIFNLFNGGSSLKRIWGISESIIRDHYSGGLGGHYVTTWLKDLVKYWGSIGIKVNLIE